MKIMRWPQVRFINKNILLLITLYFHITLQNINIAIDYDTYLNYFNLMLDIESLSYLFFPALK